VAEPPGTGSRKECWCRWRTAPGTCWCPGTAARLL